MVLGRILVGWLSGARTKVWEDGQSPVSGEWCSLASPAILLEDQVHQLSPLVAATVGLPRKKKSLGDAGSDLRLIPRNKDRRASMKG